MLAEFPKSSPYLIGLLPTFPPPLIIVILDQVIAASGGGLGDVEWPRWVEVFEGISHTLITVNSSLNFFIYLVI